MPHRLIELADKLKHLDLSDAPHLDQHQLRSVVNRAYYAAFLTARNFCDDNGLRACGSSHEKVVQALKSSPHAQWVTAGNQLQTIKELRHQADYKWERPISARDAQVTLKKSRQIIDVLKAP